MAANQRNRTETDRLEQAKRRMFALLDEAEARLDEVREITLIGPFFELSVADLLDYERQLAAWKRIKTDAGPPPERPKEPTAWRCMCSDITVEAAAVMLQENPHGVLLARDELAGWIGSFDKYREGRGADAQHWIEMHGGRTLIVDRKTPPRKTIFIPRASVCVTGGIQPDTLRRALTVEFFENGLASRLLLAMPPRVPKRWTEADIPPEQDQRLAALFDRLFEFEPGTDDEGEPEPVIFRLQADAKRLWIDFYNRHGIEQADLTGDLAAAWSKLEGYAARFALLFHCIRHAVGDRRLADPSRIDEASILAGIALVEWFGNEARRVYAVLSETDEEREDRQLLELIRRKGGRITVRELMHASRRFRGSAESAEEVLNRLAKRGLGRWIHEDHGAGPGRRAEVFELSTSGHGNTNPKTPSKNGNPLPLPSDQAASDGLDETELREREAIKSVEDEEEAGHRRGQEGDN